MFLTRCIDRVYDSILTLVYPQPCAICGNGVESRADGLACRSCWLGTRIFSGVEAICWKCGAFSIGTIPDDRREQIRCHRCDEDAYTVARSCGVYEKALRATVLSLKRQPHIPRCLAEQLIAATRRYPLNRCQRIIPVPLHPTRERTRGFNQAAIIGHEISRRTGLPMDKASLFRIVHSERHRAGMDAKARRESVEGAFSVRYPRLIDGESILLVDDVFTTGATASACAGVLVNAGAREVFVLTIARPSDY